MQRLYKYNGSVLCPNLDIVCVGTVGTLAGMPSVCWRLYI